MQTHQCNRQMPKTKLAHYSKIIAEHSVEHRSLWKAFTKILHHCPKLHLPDHSSIVALENTFISFCINKISVIYSTLPLIHTRMYWILLIPLPMRCAILFCWLHSANIPGEARLSGATAKSVFNSKIEETVPYHQQATGSDGIYRGKAKSKKCVFRYLLKVVTELAERTDSGRLFQRDGAQEWKALAPVLVFTLKTQQRFRWTSTFRASNVQERLLHNRPPTCCHSKYSKRPPSTTFPSTWLLLTMQRPLIPPNLEQDESKDWGHIGAQEQYINIIKESHASGIAQVRAEKLSGKI